MESVDGIDHLLFHLFVDLTVAGKGTAAWGVAAEFAYEGLVFEFLIDVADKSAAGHVAARNFVDGPYFLFACKGGWDNDIAGQTGNDEDFLMALVVLDVTNERQKRFTIRIGIAFNNLLGCFVEGYLYGNRVPS